MSDKKQLTNSIAAALDNALANLHTMTVARITAVNAKTIDCQPVINRTVNGEPVELPVFVDVPPISLQGGSSYIAFPLAVGDYCLLFFAERCFDRWYEGDDFALPAEYRMHDYSDGFALVGVNNRAGGIDIPNVITLIGDIFSQGQHDHSGDLNITGDLNVTGRITCANLTVGGIDFLTHVHPENDGGGPTGAPQ